MSHSATSMFMTNSLLLWWTLRNVPLPLMIKPKVAKEARQCRSERKLRQSNCNYQRIELTMQLLHSC